MLKVASNYNIWKATGTIVIMASLVFVFSVGGCDDGGVVGEVCSSDSQCLTNNCASGTCRPSFEKEPPVVVPVVVGASEWVNGGALSGPSIGLGSIPNGDLRREVAVTLSGDSADLVVSKGYLAANNAASDNSRFVARVRNVGSTTVCPGQVTGNFSGPATTVTESPSVVAWRMKKVGSELERDCIPPGEWGYLYEILINIPINTINQVALDFAPRNTGEYEQPSWQMKAKSYSYDPFRYELNVTMENPNFAAGTTFYAYVILLDEGGEPVMIGLAEEVLVTSTGDLQANDTTFYSGQVKRMEIMTTVYQ